MTALAPEQTSARPLPEHVGVLIAGSGFAGVGAAIALMKEGRHDFVVLERADDVGGTWRDNSYPGCACDVPSNLYSYSFALNPEWSHAFGRQPEIQAYLLKVADQHGVRRYLHLRTELLQARWVEDEARWHVTTNRGELTADVLVAATGPLSEPSIPRIPGADSFAGTAFHSATWDHDHDLRGRKVAVIGTGASAIQFVPHVQKDAGELTLFQRTPPWVMPRPDHVVPEWRKALFRKAPALQRLTRASIYSGHEGFILAFKYRTELMKLVELRSKRLMAKQIDDPVLRAKLTPTYRAGCKRILMSNHYFKALNEPNADVVTDAIVEIVPEGVVTVDGDGTRTVHEVDTIIWGTGFKINEQPIADRTLGTDGRTLAEHWATTGMQALHGTTVVGFPNLFFLVGPNTGLGHSSIIYIIESQVEYLLDALRTMRARGIAAVEPKPEAQQAFNADVQRDLEGTVWNAGGCASWYRDAHGRNTTLWPTFTFLFRRMVRRFPVEAYDTRPVRTPQEVAA